MASGEAFKDIANPKVAVRVGEPGENGIAEFSGILFSTRGPAGGAIVVEWNVHDPAHNQGAAGMWDTHLRLGGAAGTDLQTAQCSFNQTQDPSACQSAFLGLHITSHATAYLEGTWVWNADHDLEPGGSQVTLYSGRGILSESQGPVWMVGTASEHHVLYQYNIAGAADHYIGLAQTESAYFQPQPASPAPFSVEWEYADPETAQDGLGWAMNIECSDGIIVFGAGFYSWFSNYNGTCQPALTCQTQILNIDGHSDVQIYSLSTVGATHSLSVDGTGVIVADTVTNGFANTVTAWN